MIDMVDGRQYGSRARDQRAGYPGELIAFKLPESAIRRSD